MTITPPEGGKPAASPGKPPVIPPVPLWVKVMLFWLAGVLTVVIGVGLAEKKLDATGVALALISLLGGGLGGVMLRSVAKGSGEH